jgi:PAS domain S-box-containing protein
MRDTIRINLLKSGARVFSEQVVPVTSGGGPSEKGGTQAVMVIDQIGHILDVNDATVHLLEYEEDALLMLNVVDVIGHLDEAVLDMIVKVSPLRHPLVLDALCYRKGGTAITLEVSVQSVTQEKPGMWAISLVLHDALARRTADDASGTVEARLARAERLEMAGTLAGQIAHDFNNLLTPLLAYPELIRREVPSNKAVVEYLDIMEKTTEDMTRLTHQLLSLARRGQVGTDIFDINELAEQVIRLMQTVMPGEISVELDLAENLLSIKGSKDQMRRVLENLCQNAVDAMGESGTLQIRTENVYLDAPVARYGVVNVGEYVKISVIDSGTGIPEAIKDKIFDPFFTTKRGSKQRGSGLGLSIVHGIVRDHKGYVDLETAEGKGTAFFLYLPIARQLVPKKAGDSLPHGTERVLVVDDDSLQVQVLVSLIEVLGYSVAGVNSGEDCLNRVKEEAQPYDLIILDMVMESGRDGLGTFIELKKLNPKQRVILMSGFTKAARNVTTAQQLGAGVYLRKPLTIERVAAAIRSELDLAKALTRGTTEQKRKKRILIVDDEQMIRKLFGMIVLSEFRDVIIEQAANGREAVDAFQQGCHELIIMDLQMPVADGREAFVEIGRLCQKNSWPLPPVIFCTGFSPPESLNAIISDGSVHCLLRKPVKADALLHAVRQRLRL